MGVSLGKSINPLKLKQYLGTNNKGICIVKKKVSKVYFINS